MAGLFQYDTKLPTAAEALAGYRTTAGIAVGILFAICTVLMAVYQLNKHATIEMADELAARRKRAV
jgi:Na+/melibiose symporter-like transporter